MLFAAVSALLPFPRTLAARMRSERTLRSSVTWQKQALYGEISKPERIGHTIRHKGQQLFADGYSQIDVGGMAEAIIRSQHVPNGGERLVHRCKRLGIVYVRLGILRGHQAPPCAGGSATYLSQPSVPMASYRWYVTVRASSAHNKATWLEIIFRCGEQKYRTFVEQSPPQLLCLRICGGERQMKPHPFASVRPLSESVPYFAWKLVGAGRRINPSPERRELQASGDKEISRVPARNRAEGSDEPSKSF